MQDARVRRDALEVADNAFWQVLCVESAANGGVSAATREVEKKRHLAAASRALALGFAYIPTDVLAKDGTTQEILERLNHLEQTAGPKGVATEHVTDSLLGAIKKPVHTAMRVSEAFELYLEKISFDDQYNKDADQLYSWKKVKRTSRDYFIEVMGDLNMDEITRKHALKYEDWWRTRMKTNKNGKRGIKPNTANRHLGNIRGLYGAYYKYIGDEDRLNPFRNMHFTGTSKSSVEAFENEWVRDRILVPGLFDGLNLDLKVMIYVLIETGARMSEICNLMPEDIKMEEQIPFISIRPRDDRELKTPDSEREIPLVGVALEAMKLTPNGFEKYRGRGTLVSANLIKAFRNRDLLPTKNHVIYSLRHAFEKRMQEANIDYALRCLLMGHKNDRPAYGDGGSMEYRRDELLKITHPFSSRIFIG
ncbi:site-specific integrase [Robiginitomaculum antarcticum]|uniref:site-specific integrase n=1 Tax=Robiginitomaculum antarcticum TaxID=437507 RepID=UPI00037B2E0B